MCNFQHKSTLLKSEKFSFKPKIYNRILSGSGSKILIGDRDPDTANNSGSDRIRQTRQTLKQRILTFPVRHGIEERPGGADRVSTADKGHVVTGLYGHHRHQLHVDPDTVDNHFNNHFLSSFALFVLYSTLLCQLHLCVGGIVMNQ